MDTISMAPTILRYIMPRLPSAMKCYIWTLEKYLVLHLGKPILILHILKKPHVVLKPIGLHKSNKLSIGSNM